MINVEFYNPQRNKVTNTYKGAPAVWVNLVVNSNKQLNGLLALIDTGTNMSLLLQKHVEDLDPLGKGTISTSHSNSSTDQYVAEVTVIGIDDVAPARQLPPITIGTHSACRCDLLLGRDLLQRYRMVYDPHQGDCTLDRSVSWDPNNEHKG